MINDYNNLIRIYELQYGHCKRVILPSQSYIKKETKEQFSLNDKELKALKKKRSENVIQRMNMFQLKEFCFAEATITTKKYLLQILENDVDSLVIPNLFDHFKDCDWIKCVPTHTILYLDVLEEIAKEALTSLWLFPITKDKMFILRKDDQSKYDEYVKNYNSLIDTMPKDEILSRSILEYNVLENRIIYAFDEYNHVGEGFDEFDA